MEIIIWRLRLSVLWIFAAGGWLVSFSINLLMPGVIRDIMAGQIGGTPVGEGRMTFYALLYLIPFAMAVLCLSVNDLLNRWY